ncbi:DNA polymerase I [Bryobacter aggregatus]|uniref:DNA polymerase I n=1 Tax=Bryobacter aggregatus TaxID=360054 RepID=UPI0004E1D1E2|nr:DNA polymerase I [Bryobacter aggregatus]
MVPRLFLIDSFGFIFRAYHARARMSAAPMRNSRGSATEAVYIFHNMVKRLLATYKPEYVAAIYESLGPTFRDTEFAEYKANRTETPPDLLEQIPHCKTVLEAMRVPVLQFDGFEADDVIGTLAKRGVASGVDVVIVSSDKDMLQLVNENVVMLNPMKDDMVFDIEKTREFMGVAPSQVADLLAIKGDSVDNIPGAPGIGDKGAIELLLRFGSVEAALDRADEVEKKKQRESLQQFRDQILLSKRLATIHCDVPLEWSLDSVAAQTPDTGLLRAFYQEMEFFSLLKQLPAEESAAPPVAELEYDAFLQGLEGPAALFAEADAIGVAAAHGKSRLNATGDLPPGPRIVYDAKALSWDNMDEDVKIFGFLHDADPTAVSLETLSERHLHSRPAATAVDKALAVWQLREVLKPKLEARGLWRVWEEIEKPLIPVLRKMEKTGIRIDKEVLGQMSVDFEAQLQELTNSIYQLSGRPFNINSPQQLGIVLFEELRLPTPGKTAKTKSYSTAADVLETLAEDHEIARKVLEYRQLSKLKGTYIDALPALIHEGSGRLHTTFNQTGAATGRLSSNDPNLQNIPIRTAQGRAIRAAFVPEPGWTLVIADYSQIELRLLAHMSKDKVLVEAFRNNEDIHTRTASEVFGVPPLMVGPEQRRNAKAVNFGIVYGQSSFGLASSLGIPRSEADLYIKLFFERYSGVRKFIDATIAEVRKTGMSRTLFGRERPIPDIDSRNANARGFAERTAVNTPLQGSAADLIKLAMISIDNELSNGQWKSRMLLQVHDELVFEAPPEEVEALRKLVKREMEEVYELAVPLLVETGAGANWRDAK